MFLIKSKFEKVQKKLGRTFEVWGRLLKSKDYNSMWVIIVCVWDANYYSLGYYNMCLGCKLLYIKSEFFFAIHICF